MAIVAIVGRPNVGKSSLFNRLIGRREAIVDDTPGVTRDRLYGEVEWRGREFYVIDTGGILGEESAFSGGILSHVEAALAECDVILMVLDGQAGVTAPDEEVAQLLRRSSKTDGRQKPVVVVVNKLDDPSHDDSAADAYALGFERVAGISALHKRGLDELLDLLTTLLPEEEDEETDDEDVRLAIVGRPNVGKSSLLNRLAGVERSLVSPVAGTTRDPVDTTVLLNGQRFRLVDTAGLRKRARMEGDLEYYSFVRTLAAVDRSDMVLLLMDTQSPCTDQDKKIAAHVVQKGKGLILVLNKWDLVKGERPGDKLTQKIRDEMPFLNWAPILFTSAKNGRGVQRIAETVLAVRENRRHRIPTNVLNRMMRDVLAFDRLPSDRKGRALRVYYCSQAEVEPPTFVFFVNDPSIINSAFENHVRHELRALADFTGSPVRVFWRGKDKEDSAQA
ncbi:MAG: ribosome biogenesis GTPase Der [Synergistaceae bacterium]|nr:ribosome biogenesis GTPase Der [Synergistaceae bacterium]